MPIHKVAAPPITVKQWGSLNGATDWNQSFKDYDVACTATDGFGRAGPGQKVSLMYGMFNNDAIPNWGGEYYWNMTPKNPRPIHIENWDISGVDDFDSLFLMRMEITGDIADWDVAHVKSLRHMFASNPTFNTDVNNWDTGSVESMQGTFASSGFNQPLFNWSLSGISNRYSLSYMFRDASYFNQDLSCWDVERFVFPPSEFAINCPIDGTAKMPKWGQPPNTGCV